jgi:hypothetical protein
MGANPETVKVRVKRLKQDCIIEPAGQDFDKGEEMSGEEERGGGEAW